jgi:hypothetical protein
MYQREDLIEQLGIQDLPQDEQNEIVEVATHRIGLAVTATLTEAQFNEYRAIVDDTKEVIDAWLASNVSEYKDSVIFQQFVEGYDDDPEKNSPEKLFATIAWIQVNVPNVQELIAKALSEYKQERAQT